MSTSKRRATSQLTRDDLDREDSPEREEEDERGVFQSASKETLEKRVIRKARRSLLPESGPYDSPKPSPFAGINLSSSAQTVRGSGTVGSVNSNDPKPQSLFNGVNKTDETKSQAELDRDPEYYRKLNALNSSFQRWVEQYQTKESIFDFTPVCSDYMKHADELMRKYPVKKKEEPPKPKELPRTWDSSGSVFSSTSTYMTSSPPTFSFGNSQQGGSFPIAFPNTPFKLGTDRESTSAAAKDDKPEATPAKSSFVFGPSTSTTSSATSNGGFTFGSSSETDKTAKVQSFVFGSGSTPASSSGTLPASSFSFGSSIPAKTVPVSFGTGSSTSLVDTHNQQQSSQEANEDEENYEPPEPEAVKIEEDDAVYTKPEIKLYLKLKSMEKFEAKGKGSVFVKNLADSKHQLIVRADNALGTIWLNIELKSAIPISVMKKNVLIVCVPNPPVEEKVDEKATATYLLKCATEEDASSLADSLTSYKS